MSEMDKAKSKKPSEEEIDRMVVEQADDDSAWEEPIRVRRDKAASLSFPGELVERASFLAKLHRERGAKEWLTRIIRERIELEELAFAQAKRELKEKHIMPNE
ncbi:MAG: hypothetical protein AB9873_09500 [Syntrophobacteraceae bacterium]